MGYEDTTRSRLAPDEVPRLQLAEQAARLLFAHLEAGGDPQNHAERAREIYDRLRRLMAPPSESGESARTQAETLGDALRERESGVAPKDHRTP